MGFRKNFYVVWLLLLLFAGLYFEFYALSQLYASICFTLGIVSALFRSQFLNFFGWIGGK